MSYATTADVQMRMLTEMSDAQLLYCAVLLDDAAVLIDAYNEDASDEAKLVVSCRMVIRAMGDGETSGVPIGATQGSMSALGYSQSWTIGNGATGELYISKADKRLLGVGNSIWSYSPVEELVVSSS